MSTQYLSLLPRYTEQESEYLCRSTKRYWRYRPPAPQTTNPILPPLDQPRKSNNLSITLVQKIRQAMTMRHRGRYTYTFAASLASPADG